MRIAHINFIAYYASNASNERDDTPTSTVRFAVERADYAARTATLFNNMATVSAEMRRICINDVPEVRLCNAWHPGGA